MTKQTLEEKMLIILADYSSDLNLLLLRDGLLPAQAAIQRVSSLIEHEKPSSCRPDCPTNTHGAEHGQSHRGGHNTRIC